MDLEGLGGGFGGGEGGSPLDMILGGVALIFRGRLDRRGVDWGMTAVDLPLLADKRSSIETAISSSRRKEFPLSFIWPQKIQVLLFFASMEKASSQNHSTSKPLGEFNNAS